MSHKHSSVESTDLFLNLLADPTKLKPETKTINISKIDERTEGSDLVNDPRDQRTVNTFTSSDSERSRRSRKSRRSNSSSESSDTSRSSSSSTSTLTRNSSSTRSKRRHRSHGSSTSHKSIDDYVKKFNNDVEKERNLRHETEEEMRKEKEKEKESTYIPKYTTEREKKFYQMSLYFALDDLKGKVELTKKYTLTSDIEEMEDELRLHTEREQRKHGIVLAKDGLLKLTHGIEKINKYWDPLGAKLDGWHEQMSGNINNYEPVLGQMHDKYKKYIGKIEPEITFLWMFVGSGLTFHWTKKYVEDNGLEEVMSKNPELFKKLQSTIASAVETNIGRPETAKPEKKNELSRAEMYKRVQEMNKNKENVNEESSDDIHISQNRVNDTINQITGNKPQYSVPAQVPQYSAPSQPMSINIQKPRRLNNIMNNANTKNVIPLNTETSRGVVVDTVDSESIADIGISTSQRRLKNRIKVT